MLYRAVVAAMLVSLGGVIMIAQPAFLFGGTGINKLGLLLALLQVCTACLGCIGTAAGLRCLFRLYRPSCLEAQASTSWVSS